MRLSGPVGVRPFCKAVISNNLSTCPTLVQAPHWRSQVASIEQSSIVTCSLEHSLILPQLLLVRFQLRQKRNSELLMGKVSQSRSRPESFGIVRSCLRATPDDSYQLRTTSGDSRRLRTIPNDSRGLRLRVELVVPFCRSRKRSNNCRRWIGVVGALQRAYHYSGRLRPSRVGSEIFGDGSGSTPDFC